MSLEVERKYLNVDFNELRKKLRTLCAEGGQAHFESNCVFDTPDMRLLSNGCLLRIRTQEWPLHSQNILTFKKPVAGHVAFKTREELEMHVPDVKILEGIFEGMGYVLCAKYEKVREVWHHGGVEIVLDVLPFANVVELEGDPEQIANLENLLGLDKAEVNTNSYHTLHVAWLKANGLPEDPSFVFNDADRKKWRKRLNLE